MVGRISAVTMMVCAALTPPAAAGEDQHRERTFTGCFLYDGGDGSVWLGRPMVFLGMYGVPGNAPHFRLSADLAGKLGPLVTRLDESPADHFFYRHGLPCLKGEQDAVVFLYLNANIRLAERRRDGAPDVYEIVSARRLQVEFVTGKWLRAHDALGKALGEIVAISRTAPREEKRGLLARQIERGSRALHTMAQARAGDERRSILGKVAPDARVVRVFQRRVASEWREQLERYAARLRIKPKTLLPPKPKDCPAIELLAESESPAALIAKVKESCPPEAFEEMLLYSLALGYVSDGGRGRSPRPIYLWEVENLTPEQFGKLRTEVKEVLARRARRSEAEPHDRPRDAVEKLKSKWGVELRPAGADLLADKRMLRGTVVESVLSEGPDVGLEAGDLIIDYRGVYDLVMGRFDSFRPMVQLANKARYGGELQVLRGNRVITVTINKE